MSIYHPAKLTALSHGGGCGCKISPSVLARLLENIPQAQSADLLTGIAPGDDAAVYQLDEKRVLIATTDFFPPIVDDPYQFGRIAAANALSDIYAMGAAPALALNLLGMPIEKLAEETIAKVLRGGHAVCNEASCVIAGGHSLDSAEPFYGLAVIGFGWREKIKCNSTAVAGDALVLGKPLGIGVLSSAFKQRRLDNAAYEEMIFWSTKINSVGLQIAKVDGVHAMCDVTGFGLLGHLLEMCDASNLTARIHLDDVPVMDSALDLSRKDISTGAAARNLQSVREQLTLPARNTPREALLSDPQTNGGLLVACAQDDVRAVLDMFAAEGFSCAAKIGDLSDASKPAIVVE